MTYKEAEKVMAAISVIADYNLSGVDLDNAIGIINMMTFGLTKARKDGWK